MNTGYARWGSRWPMGPQQDTFLDESIARAFALGPHNPLYGFLSSTARFRDLHDSARQ